MSSSDLIRRPSFVDLRTQDPEVAPGQFEEVIAFERIDRDAARELTPDEAHRNGLAEGEQIGRDATLKELSPVLDEFRAVAKSMAIVREQRLMDAEAVLVEAATEIARRILRAELQSDPEAVTRIARECIAELGDDGVGVLHVAPGDLERVRAYLPELELDLTDGRIQVQADPALSPGDVVLHTPARVYDGRPERLLGAARRRVDAAGDAG